MRGVAAGALLVGAALCAAAACSVGSTRRPLNAAASVSASAAPAAFVCPTLDVAALRAKPRVIDASATFRLGELAPTRAAPPPRDGPLRVTMQPFSWAKIIIPATPRPLPFARVVPQRAWFDSGVRGAIGDLLDAMNALNEAQAEAELLVMLLERRQRLVTLAVNAGEPPADREALEACLSADYDRATKAKLLGLAEATTAERGLLAALEGFDDRSAAEELVLGWGMLDLASRADATDAVGTGRAKLEKLLEDERAETKIRAYAAVLLVTSYRRTLDHARLASTLERVALLTDDPALALPAKLERATLSLDPKKRVELLSPIVEPLATATFPGARVLLLEALAALGSAQRAAGDETSAMETFARCVREARPTEDDDRDPAGCVSKLAVGLERMATATEAIALPLEYAGTLGAKRMLGAFALLDREGARQAARFVIDRAPTATEAPLALAWLAALAPTEAERRTYVDRRNRDYAATSAWYRREAAFGAAIGAANHLPGLLSPSLPKTITEPADDDAWAMEMRGARASAIDAECTALLWADKVADDAAFCGSERTMRGHMTVPCGPRVTIEIDTTGAAPTVQLTPSSPLEASAECLERAAARHFQSVPAARITVVLVP